MITSLKSRINNATITKTNDEDFCFMARDLMNAAYFYEYEQVHIYDVHSGNSYTTTIIAVDEPGLISCRTHGGYITPKVIISSYYVQASYDNPPPKIVTVDAKNCEV